MEGLADKALPRDFSYDWGGTSYQEKRSAGTAGVALTLAVIMVFFILVSAWTFVSLALSPLQTSIYGEDGVFDDERPTSLVYVVAANKRRDPCRGCGIPHDYISRGCVPIAFPSDFAPVGAELSPALPPARPHHDIESRALLYRLAVAVADAHRSARRL